VCGFIEPLPEDHPTQYEFSNEILGNVIPPEFYPACEKGFKEAANAGSLIGAAVEVRASGFLMLLEAQFMHSLQ
jgi:elongation factor G